MANQYIVCDIETTGPCPGAGSMVSLGACVANVNDDTTGEVFSVNIEETFDADLETMAWWAKWPRAWDATKVGRVTPQVAVSSFIKWLSEQKIQGQRQIFVAGPVGFDWGFVNYYIHNYSEAGNPLGFSPLCTSSLLKSLSPSDYRAFADAFSDRSYNVKPHHALDDAIEEAVKFLEIAKVSPGRWAGILE